MFCNQCGKQLNEGARFCSGCGTKLEVLEQPEQHTNPSPPPYNTPNQYNAPYTDPKADPFHGRKFRHGFTSFYLWLNLIITGCQLLWAVIVWIINEFDAFYTILDLSLTWEYGAWGFWIYLGILGLNAYNTRNIIQYRRSGFYGLIGVAVISSFVDIGNVGPIINLLFGIAFGIDDGYFIFNLIVYGLSILITFGILKIKNAYNAKSTWEQMD